MRVRGNLDILGKLLGVDLGGGFYGINVAHSDDSASFSGIETIKVEVANFYLTQNAPNTDEIQINFRGTSGGGGVTDHGALSGLSDNDHPQYALTGSVGSGFYGVIFKESEAGGFVDKTDTLTFDSTDFYLTSGGDGKPLVSLIDRSTVAVSPGVVIKSFTSAVEWELTHNLGTTPLLWGAFDDADEAIIPTKVDVSNLNTTFFYFSEAVIGKGIVSTGASGVIVDEVESGGFSKNTGRLKFDTAFYLSSGGDGNPIVSLKDSPTGLIESFGGMIEAVDVTNYVLDEHAEYSYTIETVTMRTLSGGGEGAFYINNVPVLGLDPFYFGAIQRRQDPTSQNTVNFGDRVQFSVPQNSAGVDLSFTVKTVRT